VRANIAIYSNSELRYCSRIVVVITTLGLASANEHPAIV